MNKIAPLSTVLAIVLPLVAACVDEPVDDVKGTAQALQTSAPVELVTNGGFESSAMGWTNNGFFNFESDASAHGGSGLMLAANSNRSDRLSQDITIPNAESVSLTFWLKQRRGSAAIAQDSLRVRVLSKDGALLEELERYDDPGPSSVPGLPAYQQQGPFNLNAYIGKTIRLEFSYSSVGYTSVSFLLDDVSVMATPVPAGELLVNGGFEGSYAPWTTSALYWSASEGSAHIGTGVVSPVYSGATVSQEVDLANDRAASLSFWLDSYIWGGGTRSYNLRVGVTDEHGSYEEIVRYSAAKPVPNSYQLQGPFDLSEYRGQRIRISFSYSDSYDNVVTVRLDDVSVIQHWDQYVGPTGCADSVTVQENFGGPSDMVGCAGSATWYQRDYQCADGFSACTSQQWMNNRGGKTPQHNYWTADFLRYGGTSSACWASDVAGSGCNEPMRVCKPGGNDDWNGDGTTDNRCNWNNCGWSDASSNEYFGGCYNNSTAGTLCCRD